MSVQHTPGPWYFHVNKADTLYVVRGPKDIVVCEMSWHSSIPCHYTLRDESEANARLIAAAPDLLAALRLAQEQMERFDGESAGWHEANDAISAAIAKATGAA
jgi:hypothetical protein